MNRRILALVLAVALLQSVPSFAASSFVEDLNKGIDSAQEKLNDVAEDIEVVTEKVGEAVDKTAEMVNDTVEAVRVILSDLDNHWAKDQIQHLIDKNVIAGYLDGTFKPNASISAGEFTKILIKPSYPDQEYKQGNPWYQVYVDRATKEGIIEQGEFSDYTKPITRYEMARMIARAAEDLDKLEITSTTSTTFNDDSTITSSGKKYIKAVSTAGIITGYPDNTFGPDKNATRAEASVMLNRYLDLDGTEPVEVDIVDEMIANVLATDMETLTDIADVEDLIKRREQLIHVG
ncbi:MAG: S-layer homology domain-containing protein, partial [Clostridia bacterium]|nr:S-layer homology domain-containing protein [Clostridia bacterium]